MRKQSIPGLLKCGLDSRLVVDLIRTYIILLCVSNALQKCQHNYKFTPKKVPKFICNMLCRSIIYARSIVTYFNNFADDRYFKKMLL